MPNIMKATSNKTEEGINNFSHRYQNVENVTKLKTLRHGTELCIIQTDLNKTDLKLIDKTKATHKGTEFWIASNNLSRENVILAHKIGIKTVVSSPVDTMQVEEYFNNKNKHLENTDNEEDYNYLEIRNSKVMIVDDNLMNIELLEEILSKLHLKTYKFLKPKEAHQAVLQEKFDLFLLDVMMPEMSGFELAKKIKETQQNQNSPIVFISALSDNHSKMKGYNLGSFAYIEKPFDVNVITTQIYNILKNQRAQEIISQDKENFLATVAHDLKTPIRAGINALNLLLNENLGELEEDQQEIIEDILYSTTYMKDMVENVLCLNKIETEQMTLSKQVYSIKELVENCIELTKYITSAKNQPVRVDYSLKNPLIPFDFLEMKRALNNIIANASQYSPAGSKILIKVFNNANKVGISVQDFGDGIPLENQKEVFSQYMTFAKKNKTVGSGLGMYITKKIVKAHGGEIKLNSKVGYGTTITMYLPIYNKD